MSDKSPPVLREKSTVAIRREGGLAAFPGLMKPRRIQCVDCTDEQRQWLQGVLNQAVRTCGDTSPTGVDRRVFHIYIEESQDQDSSEPESCNVWSLTLNEEETPEALVSLWKRGMPNDDD